MNSAESRTALVDLLKAAPQQAAIGIATALASSKEGADALLTAISEGKASPRLLLERAVDGRLKTSKPSKLEERLKKLTADLPPEDDRIKKLIDGRRAGFGQAKADAGRGAEVFKKTCAGCHIVAGVGKKVGPELDGIAHRGLDRILEDVLDPNRAVDQAFRATMIKTTDGRVISGLVLREEGEVLVIQEAADKETRLPKKDVEARQLSQLSPMPANVIDPMPEPEFYDLLAFLLAQRPK
jgi:putative heme-binding domain-containing protein